MSRHPLPFTAEDVRLVRAHFGLPDLSGTELVEAALNPDGFVRR